jgi:predicted transcriptional regulator
MARRVPPTPRLGELELAVLEHLWDAREADVIETHAAIGKRRRISPNTVGSALERLFKKGLVARSKVSHAYRYRPAIERKELSARRVVEAAGGLSALGEAGLLSAFVDLVAEVDDAALDRLEALIARKRGDRGES